MKLNSISEGIKNSSLIGITFHTSADGDSLGSALGLLNFLRKIGKKAYIISKERLPEVFSFLPNGSEIDGNTVNPSRETDLVIALDCGNIERLNWNANIDDRWYKLFNVDHHLSNSNYGDLNHVDPTKSSVGEIIYEIIKTMDGSLDKEIASCLYTSLLTDTGGFKHTNTTPKTLLIASELIATGIDFSEIYRVIFENKKISRMKLYGKVIENIELYCDSKICCIEIKKGMLAEFGETEGDTSDLISLGMKIDKVEVAALFKETDKEIKISLRSKHNFDVRSVAELYGGGGHTKASGLRIEKPIEEAKQLIVKHIKEGLL